MFAPVQEAATAVQTATAADVTHDDLASLVKTLGTALAAVRARPLDAEEGALLAAYQEVFDAYDFSVDLWTEKIRRQGSEAGGDRVPVQIGTMKLDSLIKGATQYGLPLLDETLPGGVKLKVLPADAHERVWVAADAALARASAMLRAQDPTRPITPVPPGS
jgi:hypothetical protein